MSWPAVIVLAVMASCAVAVGAPYFLKNSKTRAAASAAHRKRTSVPLASPAPGYTA